MSNVYMIPGCGERLLRFVGDRIRLVLRGATPEHLAPGWRGMLRTNVGRAQTLREEVVSAHFQKVPLAGASWRDIPMRRRDGEWEIELVLSEVGFFRAKAYALDPQGRQHWPDGPDFGVSVHPDNCRTDNTIYCAFTRLFGEWRTRTGNSVAGEAEEHARKLDGANYAVIPPSGKLRDLIGQLPHIFETLGCRILHLLPINPTPTTMARFGRFGSPYAALDLTAIDPGLVVFDQRTTGLEQFQELVRAVHLHHGKIFLDLVINHTGWGATLWEQHPEWYRRLPDGEFESPGAWGNIWRDLVELDQRHPALWAELAESFVTWCRRGVDGFRCDAGYKVPVPVWQHIVARVRQEYPNTIFLLEGLGGAWEATEALLTEGGMQWAYSELFQNYSGSDVARYLDYSLNQCRRVGLYTHYSETHDNARLAASGKAWALLRNRLCALASTNGGFGFTCGVEWLARDKINVHQCHGLNWGAADNLVDELRRLNRLLGEHPCFFDGVEMTRLSPADSAVLALLRVSADGHDRVLVLVNTDLERESAIELNAVKPAWTTYQHDLLGQPPPRSEPGHAGATRWILPPGGAYCLSPAERAVGLSGDAYRVLRAQAAWAVTAISQYLRVEQIGPFAWQQLAALAAANPVGFLGTLRQLDPQLAEQDLLAALQKAIAADGYPAVVVWNLLDVQRVTVVPPEHWLLIEDRVSFRAALHFRDGRILQSAQSIRIDSKHIAAFGPFVAPGEATLALERNVRQQPELRSEIVFLPKDPDLAALGNLVPKPNGSDLNAPVVLLTNGLGGMTRMCVDLGRIKSKYDCVLGANLHPEFPVDRHIFVKRLRIWVNADGFITPLNAENLLHFEPGPPARWRFVANAGDGRSAEIELCAEMMPGENTVCFHLTRPAAPPPFGRDLPAECSVRLTVRFDIEDRNFHWETHRNGGAEFHFSSNTRPLAGAQGFSFTPAADRQLYVVAEKGTYHHEAEWSTSLPHPVEASRAQWGEGDAFSPGWFDLPLRKAETALLVVAAGTQPDFHRCRQVCRRSPVAAQKDFPTLLAHAAKAFVVRRGQGKTVVAGYPWFLDWGRDTLICARGLLSAGLHDEVRELLQVFGQFEEQGTLPNTIHGGNATNRDTTDAPLWYGVVCEDLAGKTGAAAEIYKTRVAPGGRTIAEVLQSIAEGYLRGTANGIRVDADSALVWSPSHFTWMDTNYPAGTPREGYPVEIQALWIRLLRQLAGLKLTRTCASYTELAQQAEASFRQRFWLPGHGWLADVLIARPGVSAKDAVPDQVLRSNGLLAVTLGLLRGDAARQCVENSRRYLVVPGALRTLAPLPANPPLPIHAPDGRLLNDPASPYWGRYEGDEDTRRKPAYHNGTAWVWTFPTFCEALAMAYDFSEPSVAAARAYLASTSRLLTAGCLGQLPEIIDGDAPHQARGCDAQAWSVTETLRVWEKLNRNANASGEWTAEV